MKLRFEKRAKNFTPKIDYVMTDERGKLVFEAVCIEWKAMTNKDNTYEFVNHITGQRKLMKVSHSYGAGNIMRPEALYTPYSAYMIDIDGIPHWQFLNGYGVTVTSRLNGVRLECEIFDGEEKVGQFVNDLMLFGKLPVPDRYTVEIKQGFEAAAFVACFIAVMVAWTSADDM